MGRDEVSGSRQRPPHEGAGLRVGIVASRFNDVVTERLISGVERGLAAAEVNDGDVTLEWVPGAFEIPYAARAMIGSGRFDVIIGVGCVIRGETTHYDFVAGECARGVQDVELQTGIPVIFGVLTTEDLDQALARSEPAGGYNVGEESAFTAVEMVALARRYGA